ncbi:AAA family ATPase [Sphingobacterium sp. HJSM2_6]|uniref:AAA family ATPase n=1 Tax=Sphingobacterium sp. HJSM2_6 TaxID=3366264 RepID=UPI003BE5EBDF
MTIAKTQPLKIAIVGPESTGKSSMAQYLAQELNTLSVPEYARYYCKNLERQYTFQDELNMFYGQIALEDAFLAMKPEVLICDTTFLTVKIWSDHLFHHAPEEVLQELGTRSYDLYLLMNIDLPWVDDPLRDFPNDRAHFLSVWEKELVNLSGDIVLISGLGEERMQAGLKAASDFLHRNK